jgi:hypothetical protein
MGNSLVFPGLASAWLDPGGLRITAAGVEIVLPEIRRHYFHFKFPAKQAANTG